jgi:hypothetical protein
MKTNLLNMGVCIAIGCCIWVMLALKVEAAAVCPAGYPVDCGKTHCCPSNTYCVSGGACVPNGWSDCGGGKCCPPGLLIACPRLKKCFSGQDTAANAGCSITETLVCGTPVQVRSHRWIGPNLMREEKASKPSLN